MLGPGADADNSAEVIGHGKGMITRVNRRNGRTRIQVEMSDDLQKREFDLARIRWRRL